MAASTKGKLPSAAVIDASFVLARLFPDEKHTPKVAAYFDRFAQGKLKLIAPQLLKYEVTNALRSALVQKRLTSRTAKQLLQEFLKLPIDYLEVEFEQVLTLAVKYKISAYDAAYVFLVKKKQLPLLSLDKKLAKVA